MYQALLVGHISFLVNDYLNAMDLVYSSQAMFATPQFPRTIRIALLICVRLSGPIEAVNGSYYDIFRRFLTDSLPHGSDTIVVVDGFDVAEEMKYPEDTKIPDYDMILVTGSGAPFAHPDEEAYIDLREIAASAFEDTPWIKRLVVWIQRVAGEYPKVKICGESCFSSSPPFLVQPV